MTRRVNWTRLGRAAFVTSVTSGIAGIYLDFAIRKEVLAELSIFQIACLMLVVVPVAIAILVAIVLMWREAIWQE